MVDIMPPYALQMWNPYYKYAAQPLNWQPTSMANGRVDGNVTQVRSWALWACCSLSAIPLLFDPSLQWLCTDGHLFVPVLQPYAVLLAQGASYVNFNLLVGSTEADMLPWMVYLEGAPCNVSRLAR